VVCQGCARSVPPALASPSPHFSVSVASKGLIIYLSVLESALTKRPLNIDYKGLAAKHSSWAMLAFLSREPTSS
jgi:hypothetical protein